LHRNPTMHPEVFYDIKEALALFDIAKSAIVAMAAEIAKLQAIIEDEEANVILDASVNEETTNTTGH
jgi:hypothetical protein